MRKNDGARIAINPHQLKPLDKEADEISEAFAMDKPASGRALHPARLLGGVLVNVNIAECEQGGSCLNCSHSGTPSWKSLKKTSRQ